MMKRNRVSQPQSSWLDQPQVAEFILKCIADGDTNATIARKIGTQFGDTSEKSIRRFRKRHNANPDAVSQAYTKIEGDTAEGQGEPSTTPVLDDPDTMLRERGLDPGEWAITHVTANEYQGPASAGHTDATGETKVTYYQTKFTATKIRPDVQLIAARSDGWKNDFRVIDYDNRRRLVVVTGDQQAPFHDPHLDGLFRQWLSDYKPERGILLGDTVDFPDISRHQLDPENTAAVNECIQSGYDLLRGYVESSPGTHWQKLAGNHDERLRNLILDKPKNHALYGLKRPDTPDSPGEDVLGLIHLLRLDELGIDYVDPHGGYELGQIVLSPKLAVRHGWLVRKGSGATALATLEHLGYSVIVGHTHRQSVVHETKAEIDGEVRVLTGVEAGCMCRIKQTVGEDGRVWPNYTVAPDWQQGFCTVEIWDDGYFNIDTAKYVNGTLMWRDERYS